MNELNECRYCGRDFTKEEIESIRRLMRENPDKHRTAISKMVCRELSWLKPDGGLKEMSCRVAMLRMEADGLLRLPPLQGRNHNGRHVRRRTPQGEPPWYEITTPAGKFTNLCLRVVSGRKDSHLWNELIDRYHYLGYKPLPGAQLRYFAESDGEKLALLGFGAAAWKTAPRDDFIGWTPAVRERNLHLIVNNARFLILPWVKSKNLASKLLGMVVKQLPGDWEERYGYRPTLLETFVERARFEGTCYKAANWSFLGYTKGRGKLDTHHRNSIPVKAVFTYPLAKSFKKFLCGSAT